MFRMVPGEAPGRRRSSSAPVTPRPLFSPVQFDDGPGSPQMERSEEEDAGEEGAGDQGPFDTDSE